MYILFLFLYTTVAQLPTCTEQLYNYYVTLGLPPAAAVPTEPVNIVAIPGGVEINFNFQSIAFYYQSLTPLPGAPNPIINYVSFPRQFCIDSIDVRCGGTLLAQLPKTAACPLIDYNVFELDLAGRFFIYNPQAGGAPLPPGCNGDITLRLFGDFTLINGVMFPYTYSLAGLPTQYTGFNVSDAVADYQNSLCEATYGNTTPPVPANQTQFVCNSPSFVCQVQPRPGTVLEVLTPLPTYACRGPVPGLVGNKMVWHVSFLAQRNGLTFLPYCVHFCSSTDLLCQIAGTPDCSRVGEAGTRSQWVSPFDTFDSVMVITYNGTTIVLRPIYSPAVTDLVIRDLPCVCGLTIDCNFDGTINDESDVSKILQPNNAAPQANASINLFFLPGPKTITLSARSSFDPDNAPNILSFYWKIYNATPSPVTLTDIRSPDLNVTADFVLGVYQFVVYVSDGQFVYYDLVNITIEANVIVVVLPRFVEVQWRVITQCPTPNTIDALRPVAFALNGSASFGENPNITLYYNWTQTSGSNITVPFECDPTTVEFYPVEAFFDTNFSISRVFFPTLGLYTFRLTICDNGTSPCRFQEIHVSVELNFDSPNSTKTNYSDYPNAPTFNTSNGSVPTVTFVPTPAAPFVPITRPPSFFTPTAEPFPPAPITAIFPQLPPPSLAEKLLLLMGFLAGLAVVGMLFGYCLAQLRNDYYARFDRIAIYIPPVNY